MDEPVLLEAVLCEFLCTAHGISAPASTLARRGPPGTRASAPRRAGARVSKGRRAPLAGVPGQRRSRGGLGRGGEGRRSRTRRQQIHACPRARAQSAPRHRGPRTYRLEAGPLRLGAALREPARVRAPRAHACGRGDARVWCGGVCVRVGCGGAAAKAHTRAPVLRSRPRRLAQPQQRIGRLAARRHIAKQARGGRPTGRRTDRRCIIVGVAEAHASGARCAPRSESRRSRWRGESTACAAGCSARARRRH